MPFLWWKSCCRTRGARPACRVAFLVLAAVLFGCAAMGQPEEAPRAPDATPPVSNETSANADAEAEADQAGEIADLTLEQVLDQMEQARKGLKTFEGKVIKHRNVVPLEDIEVFDGRIRFKAPRKLYLELKSRDTGRKTIYIVGEEYGWIYRPDDNQAEGIPLKALDEKKRQGNPLQYGLAENVYSLKRSYNLKLGEPEKVRERQAVVMELLPHGVPPDSTDGKVVLWLDPATWQVVQVREFKNDGDVIETHTFHEMKRNVEIPDEVFDWEPGDDVDVSIHPVD